MSLFGWGAAAIMGGRSRRRVWALLAALVLGGGQGGLSGQPARATAGAEPEECNAGSETYLPGGDHSESTDPHVVPLGGLVFELDLDGDFVYALHQLTVPMESSGPGPAYRSSSMAVSRVDRRTREVVRGDSLCFGFQMALAGPSLWVLDLEFHPDSCHGVLYRFDPDTLRRTAIVNLPPPPPLEPSPPPEYTMATPDPPTPCDTSAMTSTPDGRLWVAVGRHLHRLSGDDGSIEATVLTDAPASDLAADPTGRHLYSAEEGTVVRRHADLGVAEVDAEADADLPDSLGATPTGVWVAVRDGPDSERQLVHLDRRHLRETARADQPVEYALALGERSFWAIMGDGLHCADATTGRLRASGPQGPRATEIAADGAGVYLNTPDADRPDRNGIYVAEPHAGCRW